MIKLNLLSEGKFLHPTIRPSTVYGWHCFSYRTLKSLLQAAHVQWQKMTSLWHFPTTSVTSALLFSSGSFSPGTPWAHWADVSTSACLFLWNTFPVFLETMKFSWMLNQSCSSEYDCVLDSTNGGDSREGKLHSFSQKRFPIRHCLWSFKAITLGSLKDNQ